MGDNSVLFYVVDSGGSIGVENREGDLSRQQAELFCNQLHTELDRLERETRELQATLARQGARADLRRHAAVTQVDLKRATAERDHILKMLATMGHPHPCRH